MIRWKYTLDKLCKNGIITKVEYATIECDNEKCEVFFDKMLCYIKNKKQNFCSNECKETGNPPPKQAPKPKIIKAPKPKRIKVKKPGTVSIKEKWAIPEERERMMAQTKKTNLERYGTEYPMKSDRIRLKSQNALNALLAIPEEQEKILIKRKQTCLETYGVESSSQAKEVRDKIDQTMIERYGAKNPLQCPELKQRIQQTNLERYGSVSYLQSDKNKADNLEKYGVENISQTEWFQEKAQATKKKNGSHTKSEPEEKTYKILIDHFGKDNVVRQFMIKRWPIDFYIPSLDGYVEENGVYYHGLNRPLEEIMKFANEQDKSIYEHILTDRKKVSYFASKNKPLAIITDQQINKLPPSEVLQIILSQLTIKPTKS
jgi:hypothetical protein